MNCVICRANKKYKCSKCRMPYCSSQCYQVHRNCCVGEVVDVKKFVEVGYDAEPIVKTDFISD